MPDATGQYKVYLSHATHKAIRHMPVIVQRCTQIALHGQELAGEGWEVIVQNDPQTQRPRAYLVCRDPDALRRDAKESTLMKVITQLRNYNPSASNSAISSAARQIFKALT